MIETNGILKLVNVCKGFSNNFEVVKNVNLSVEHGKFVCFIGPSGCGKTVLLYTIAGFLPVTSGKILKNGKTVNSVGPDRIMVFQDNMLFPWKTVIQNVLFALSNFNLERSQKVAMAENYLETVGLLEFKDWPIHKLSGGMKQRVAFARALVTSPEILLMDEPFSALDSIARKHVRKALMDVWQKTKQTILFVTHSVIEAIYLADTVHVMGARPTTVKKTYDINLPRPRDIMDPKFSKLVRLIEADIQKEFINDTDKKFSDIDINNILINNI